MHNAFYVFTQQNERKHTNRNETPLHSLSRSEHDVRNKEKENSKRMLPRRDSRDRISLILLDVI